MTRLDAGQLLWTNFLWTNFLWTGFLWNGFHWANFLWGDFLWAGRVQDRDGFLRRAPSETGSRDGGARHDGAQNEIPLTLWNRTMASSPDSRKTNFRQLSLRMALLLVAVIAAVLAVANIRVRAVQEDRFVRESVRPIVDQFVCSVGYSDGRVLWLRVNRIDPHHRKHREGWTAEELETWPCQWEVPIVMDMYTNSGSVGRYRKYGDLDLRRTVADHPHLRALDLRDSDVSDAGLAPIAKLKKLEWLWIDAGQCTESGLKHLHGMTSLRKIRIDGGEIDPGLADSLASVLAECEIEHRFGQESVDPADVR